MTISVSVAMATYNGAAYLPEQLASLAAQTALPAELVVTDDGSSDGTVGIVTDFAVTAPFSVRLVQNDIKLGYKANFMKAASLCTGEVIAFCDQDDVWDPSKIAVMAETMAGSDSLMAYHGFRLVDDAGRSIPPRGAPARRKGRDPWENVYGISEVFRRSLLVFSDLWDHSVDHLYPSERMSHDQWFYFLAHAFGAVSYVDRELVSYRQHGSNVFGFVPSHAENIGISATANMTIMGDYFRGRPDRLRQKRDHLGAYYRGLELGARERGRICGAIVQRGGEKRDLTCFRTGQMYRDAEQYYGTRARMYLASDLKTASANLARSLSLMVRQRRGVRGMKDGVLDLTFGVLR